jgi:hypothetical protein
MMCLAASLAWMGEAEGGAASRQGKNLGGHHSLDRRSGMV